MGVIDGEALYPGADSVQVGVAEHVDDDDEAGGLAPIQQWITHVLPLGAMPVTLTESRSTLRIWLSRACARSVSPSRNTREIASSTRASPIVAATPGDAIDTHHHASP